MQNYDLDLKCVARINFFVVVHSSAFKLNTKVAGESPIYQFTRTLINNEPCKGIQIDFAYDADRRFQGNFSYLYILLFHILHLLPLTIKI